MTPFVGSHANPGRYTMLMENIGELGAKVRGFAGPSIERMIESTHGSTKLPAAHAFVKIEPSRIDLVISNMVDYICNKKDGRHYGVTKRWFWSQYVDFDGMKEAAIFLKELGWEPSTSREKISYYLAMGQLGTCGPSSIEDKVRACTASNNGDFEDLGDDYITGNTLDRLRRLGPEVEPILYKMLNDEMDFRGSSAGDEMVALMYTCIWTIMEELGFIPSIGQIDKWNEELEHKRSQEHWSVSSSPLNSREILIKRFYRAHGLYLTLIPPEENYIYEYVKQVVPKGSYEDLMFDLEYGKSEDMKTAASKLARFGERALRDLVRFNRRHDIGTDSRMDVISRTIDKLQQGKA